MPARKELRNYNGLTEKEQRFCDEYLKSQDMVKAMKAAGYALATAKRKGYDMYRRPQVQDYLQTIAKSIERETIASTAEIREYLTRVMRGEEEVTELVNVFQGGGFQVTNRETRKPNIREKSEAADKLLRISGAYQKDINVNVKPIVIHDDLDTK